jgi:hypothetical protein
LANILHLCSNNALAGVVELGYDLSGTTRYTGVAFFEYLGPPLSRVQEPEVRK